MYVDMPKKFFEVDYWVNEIVEICAGNPLYTVHQFVANHVKIFTKDNSFNPSDVVKVLSSIVKASQI